MPPPVPPSVKAGLSIAGNPICFDRLQPLFHAGHSSAPGEIEADLLHRLLEKFPVLGFLDRRKPGADKLDIVLFEYPLFRKLYRKVQRCLAAHGGQYRIRPLFLDDQLKDLNSQRFNIRDISCFRVGHDRGGIGIDQDDSVPFVSQGLARLRSGVIELAGLAYDDRT